MTMCQDASALVILNYRDSMSSATTTAHTPTAAMVHIMKRVRRLKEVRFVYDAKDAAIGLG